MKRVYIPLGDKQPIFAANYNFEVQMAVRKVNDFESKEE